MSQSNDQRLAVLRLGGDGHPVALDLRAGDLGLEVELQPLLRQALLEQVADLDVGQRHDPGQELDDRDLRAQPLPDRAELQADVAAADDDQVLGNLVEAEGLGRADDRLAVERQERQGDRLAAGGQEDVAGLERRSSPRRSPRPRPSWARSAGPCRRPSRSCSSGTGSGRRR